MEPRQHSSMATSRSRPADGSSRIPWAGRYDSLDIAQFASHIKNLMSGDSRAQGGRRVDMLSEEFAESVNVAAYMYGTTRPDEYVVISGHIDCWWAGANDDSSSIAAMLEFARLFSEAREAGTFINERTLVFCSVGAEEEGGPQGTWYNWLWVPTNLCKLTPRL